MNSIGAIFTGIGIVEKVVPVIEQVAADIGPVVKQEIADGQAVWADIERSLADLKAAFSAVKAIAQASSK